MGTPRSDLREPQERASPRARLMWRCVAVAEGLVLVAALTAGVVLTDLLRWWLLVPLALAVAAYAVVVPQWRYRVHRWEVTDTAVYTQTGWWVRERRIAPMSRIQTVEHTQGPVDRLFGLASVRVTTASAAGALLIEGLPDDRARSLAEELTRKADAVEGDAT
ncbi:PH domain-containing protein [Nocardioides pantholopis]|uniref:PH domain-containing protein n=1 Tax=Nocardioides pantholopis TaxID=2483798 RepID=UPI000F08B866|nr:PH domain-containing protein [Nocardioides pantholopis]